MQEKLQNVFLLRKIGWQQNSSWIPLKIVGKLDVFSPFLILWSVVLRWLNIHKSSIPLPSAFSNMDLWRILETLCLLMAAEFFKNSTGQKIRFRYLHAIIVCFFFGICFTLQLLSNGFLALGTWTKWPFYAILLI